MKKQPTDFKKIMQSIHNAGFIDQVIADRTGLERSKITRIRLGNTKNVAYDDGLAIIEFYEQIKKK